MSDVAVQGAISVPWLSLASILVLVAGVMLPSVSKTPTDPVEAAINFVERLLLSLSFALVLAILVGQVARIEAEIARIATGPAIAVAALFAGRCIGRAVRDVRFLQLSVFLGFAISVVFIAVRNGTGFEAAPTPADWRQEVSVVIGASLFIAVMHLGAALDPHGRRKTA